MNKSCKKSISISILIIQTLLLVLISGCKSYGYEIKEEWTDEMFFKAAQEKFGDLDLDGALFYYDVFMIRYPENPSKLIAAEYEKAYILYKKEMYEESEEYFNNILDKYENSIYAYMYPDAYKVLSEIVLEKIQKLKEIKELPFFQRNAAMKEFYGRGIDEKAKLEQQQSQQRPPQKP